jgi:hypothetical protein
MRHLLTVLGITALAAACAPQTPTEPARPSTPYFDEDTINGGGGTAEDTVCRGGFLGSGTRC